MQTPPHTSRVKPEHIWTCSYFVAYKHSLMNSWVNSVPLDLPSVINHLVQSLPPLPTAELTDPHDDITLPRLIEALQNRYRIRQMMVDEFNKAGACLHFLAQLLLTDSDSSGLF